jgi:hypothetical membrane protein
LEQTLEKKGIPRENLIGFLAPLVSLLCILIATTISPNFDWLDNALSDLGSWYRTDLGNFQIFSAILFNGGLILTGLLTIYFTIWMMKRLKDVPIKIGFGIFLGPSLFLIGVGIFSEDFTLAHILSAVFFFFSIPISILIIGLVLLRLREMRIVGFVSILFAVLSLGIIFQPWIILSVAIFETLEALVLLGWIWFVNIMDLRGGFSSIQV